MNIADLAHALLPQDCQLCMASSGRRLLCTGCLRALPRPEPGCPICATSGSTAICGACLKKAPYFDVTYAALSYSFPADRLIQFLKYGARLPIAVLLGELLSERVPRDACPPDILMPMPLHENRLKRRGFNQALEIAKQVVKKSAHRLEYRGLVRIRDTPPQTDLPAKRRRANVRNAFACNLFLEGMTVALIDDVMTTGATLNEVARVLKKAGARRVENWVVARTQSDHYGQFHV